MLKKPFTGNYPVTLAYGAKYGRIFGLFGKKHKGIDFGLPCGTHVKSPGDGIVRKVKFSKWGYGNHVYVQYGGVRILFAHLFVVHAVVGQMVLEGQTIGEAGRTGWATGCHLHIGVLDQDRTLKTGVIWHDPTMYFDFTGAPKRVNPPKFESHRVVKGDTLWGISARFYGSGIYWPRIHEANKDKIRNPNLIYPGQVFRIPK